MLIYNLPKLNQKWNSITVNNGQRAYISWNSEANAINIRIIPIIPTPNLLNFKLFLTPYLLNFWRIFQPPPHLFQHLQLFGTLE